MFDINVSRQEVNTLSSQINNNKESLNKSTEYNYNAFYLGIVEDTNDPEKLGRIKVRIPAFMGTDTSQGFYLDTDNLPWARPAILNGGTNDMGSFIVPIKGSMVVTSFEFDDFNSPLYFGTVPTKIVNPKVYNDNSNIYKGEDVNIKTSDRIADLSDESAQTIVYKSLKGSTIIIDDKDGKENIKIIDATGQVIELGNDGKDALPRRGKKEKPPKSASPFISIRNNLGEEIYIEKGSIDIYTDNGEEISLAKGKIDILTGSTEFNLTDESATIKTGSDTFKMSGDNIEAKSGSSSISINGNNATVSSGSSSISMIGGACTLNCQSFNLGCPQSGTNVKLV